ncbi:MAG: hypothetical protein IJB32_06050 [Clostridia bacterium]|nr:hypothetical protein [Clostridia bacterium]
MYKFFKSTWFKCITVLLVLSVVLGGTLALLNDVLYVSPEERTSRAIKKIYGEEKVFSIVLDANQGDSAIENEFGKINKIYTVGNDTLYQSVGYQGYKNGTITLWVQISGNKIQKIIMESYDKQTLMSKLDGTFYNKFLIDVTDAYNNGEFFTPSDKSAVNYNPISGATKSANAGCNAVNCIIKYLGDK